MKKYDAWELIDRLSEVKEPRREGGNYQHPLLNILFIAMCSIVCGFTRISEFKIFAEERREWLEKYLNLSSGLPSYCTYERVLGALSPIAMEQFYKSWVYAIRDEGKHRQVSIDGKTIRGAGAAQKVHMVSAWLSDEGLCLGQLNTGEKTNEMATIPDLLEMLEIHNCVVTVDAAGCYKPIAQEIRQRGGDYVLAVKDNQPSLAQDVQQCFEENMATDTWKGKPEKGHGRIETRQVEVYRIEDWPDITNEWKDIHSFAKYTCTREVDGKKSKYTRYYISSLCCSAEEMAQYLRGHWSIENNLHWMLDVVMKEDASIIRTDFAPENLNVIRKVALHLLKNTPVKGKVSTNGKMMKAALSTSFPDTVLFA